MATHRHYFRGWWSTATYGVVGATAAVAKIYGLDSGATSHAIGLAQQALSEGVTVLRGIISNPDTPASARVAAFARLEDMSRRGVELEDLVTRVATLEQRLTEDAT